MDPVIPATLLLMLNLASSLTIECPEDFPYAYYNGHYCCKNSYETYYTPQGSKCDGSKIGLDSLCCLNHVYTPCPGDSCIDRQEIPDSPPNVCPDDHPNVYLNGFYCCHQSYEKVSTTDGDKCDGSKIGFSSSCCLKDEYIPCPVGICAERVNNLGCPVNKSSELYTKEYTMDSQPDTFSWKFTLPTEVLPNKVNWPSYPYMPDGHISAIEHPDSGAWYLFYPNSGSYRTIGSSPLPQDATALNPSNNVIGGRRNEDVYNNGGEWLMSVHQTDSNGGLMGFVHSEDLFWTQQTGFPPGNKAYKSVSLACSNDWGVTWVTRGQIITRGQKPSEPDWSGTGDMDVVWDWQQKRWFLMTQTFAAVSEDKTAPGYSWKKWNGTHFSGNNLLDEMQPLKDTGGNYLVPGANPSIHWNSFLQLWLAVYHGWNGNIYIMSAKTLPNFSPPRVLVEAKSPTEKNWYPTLISPKFGDRRGTAVMFLYYRHFPQGTGAQAYFLTTRLRFCVGDTC